MVVIVEFLWISLIIFNLNISMNANDDNNGKVCVFYAAKISNFPLVNLNDGPQFLQDNNRK